MLQKYAKWRHLLRKNDGLTVLDILTSSGDSEKMRLARAYLNYANNQCLCPVTVTEQVFEVYEAIYEGVKSTEIYMIPLHIIGTDYSNIVES